MVAVSVLPSQVSAPQWHRVSPIHFVKILSAATGICLGQYTKILSFTNRWMHLSARCFLVESMDLAFSALKGEQLCILPTLNLDLD